jgi:hypothetical protein
MIPLQAASISNFASIVNASDADVVFRSSDHVLFRIHRKNLEFHSAVMSPEGGDLIISTGDVTDLPETSAVLELLFCYFYRQRQPDLLDVPFHILADLAEAAEKYEVFAAMNICKEYMESVRN